MREVLVSKFKAKCISLMNSVAESGDEVLVTRRGTPLVRVVAARPKSTEPRRLGDSAETVVLTGDLLAAEFTDEWESLRD